MQYRRIGFNPWQLAVLEQLVRRELERQCAENTDNAYARSISALLEKIVGR
jgi:hypothetical protein